MTAHVKISGSWKQVTDPRVKVSGSWKKVSDGWVKVDGSWKRFYRRFFEAVGTTSFLAGTQGTTGGYQDGTGTGAKFNSAGKMAMGPDGNIYVCDGTNRRIRKVTPEGVVTTFVGNGSTSGTFTAGTGTGCALTIPTDITYNAAEGCFFACVQGASSSAVRVVKITTAGVVTSISFNVMGSSAASITSAADGNMYVGNSSTSPVIYKVTPSGTVTTLCTGGSGTADGNSSTARFTAINGIVMHSNGYLYISDGNRIRQVDTSGNVITILGTTNAANVTGTGTTARLFAPRQLVETADGYLYVVEAGNHGVNRITVSTTLNGGTKVFVAGSQASPGVTGYVEGTGSVARFNGPTGICAYEDGTLYVGDGSNYVVRKVV